MVQQAGMETTLRAAMAERLGESRFGLWFGEGVRLGVMEDSLEVGVPNAFFRDWIQGHFAGNLIDAAREVTGRSLRLAFRVADEAPPPLGHVVEPPPPDPNHRPTAPTIPIPINPPPIDRPRSHFQAPTPTPSNSPAPARPARRLEDFVTGPGNRLAHSAALELVHAAGASFNPLVIQGGVGLGKTHLLEGIGAALRARHPGMKVIHMTAESFTNGFLDAMRHGTLTAFRARYRGAGALLVDDVHFLAAKKATQDEFLHTFNALIAEGAPIILTSDQHPRQIAKLTDELATRFLGGMVVKLDAPDPATRRAILKAKAAARGVIVPEAVLGYVADNLRASVRELEGALHSLIAHATMVGKKLDLALARTALRDTIRHTARAVGLKDVERAVCQLFGIEAEALKADNRARAVAYPRMVAMYLARKHTGAAYSEIGRFFGGRNHSTVISAEKKVKGWLADESRNGLLAGFETIGEILGVLERSLGA
ncbi:chromosomal replication initiator protein DnaA [Tundrisphaera lichenicola]|uniref:chromosomal replication initiator protein DnaA n=1 Tax=Tundrisphaera lichenicola TaxID=2029860 RepID=UPI003EB7CC07